MTSKHKSKDYKLSAVEYYLVGDKSQVEVCEIFKCSPRSLMRWFEKYEKEGVKKRCVTFFYYFFYFINFFDVKEE